LLFFMTGQFGAAGGGGAAFLEQTPRGGASRHRTEAQVRLDWHLQKPFGFPFQQQSEREHDPPGDGDGGEAEHIFSGMAPASRSYIFSYPAGAFVKMAFEPVHTSSETFFVLGS
jgi:hypothetical protein